MILLLRLSDLKRNFMTELPIWNIATVTNCVPRLGNGKKKHRKKKKKEIAVGSFSDLGR